MGAKIALIALRAKPSCAGLWGDLDIIVADDLAPACDFRLEERLGGVLRLLILRENVEALVGPLLDDGGIGDGLLHRGVEDLDRLRRRAGRREQALPIDNVETRPERGGEAFGGRKLRRLFLGCDGIGLELAGIDL